MYKETKRATTLFLIFIGVAIVYTIIYDWMYNKYEEGESSSFIDSLQTVIEALTTAGFGGHAPWSSDLLNLLVISMNLTGVAIFFFTIPLVVIPYLNRTLSEPPKSTSKEDHIVVVSDDAESSQRLKEELSELDRSYVFIENDGDKASELYRRGIPVVQANPKTREGMMSANLQEADTLVANITERSSISILYTAKQINDDMRIVSVAQNEISERLSYSAGADKVLNLSTELGEILAERAVSTFSGGFEDVMQSNEEFEITKLVIFENSPVVNSNIREFSEEYLESQDVIAGHFGREFIVSPSSSRRIAKNAVLYLSGSIDDIEKTESQPVTKPIGEKILVCGAGRVGGRVSEFVDSENYDTVNIDVDESKNPDVIGDVTEPSTYDELDLDNYKSVVLAVDDDASAVYACSLINNLSEDTKIVCRANSMQSVQNMYLAGADQVILVPKLIDAYKTSNIGADIDNVHTRINASTVENKVYQDVKIRNTNLGEDIGSRIVAVHNKDEWIVTDISDISISMGDRMIVVGTDDEIGKTEVKFGEKKDS